MVTNLEGLLERIVLLSSCAGEQGTLHIFLVIDLPGALKQERLRQGDQ